MAEGFGFAFESSLKFQLAQIIEGWFGGQTGVFRACKGDFVGGSELRFSERTNAQRQDCAEDKEKKENQEGAKDSFDNAHRQALL